MNFQLASFLVADCLWNLTIVMYNYHPYLMIISTSYCTYMPDVKLWKLWVPMYNLRISLTRARTSSVMRKKQKYFKYKTEHFNKNFMKCINTLTNLNGITGLLKQFEIISLLLRIVFTAAIMKPSLILHSDIQKYQNLKNRRSSYQ